MPSVTAAALKPKDWSPVEIMEGFINMFDNTNVVVWRLGGEDRNNATYIATTDFPLVNIIDPDTLAVTGRNMPPLADGISMQVRYKPIS